MGAPDVANVQASAAPSTPPRLHIAWWFALLAAVALFGLMTGVALHTDVPIPDLSQRAIYRVFFLHVPTAIAGRLLLYTVLVASVLYLWRRPRWADWLNRACIEIAFVAYTFVVASGMMWGASAWGVAWRWEPRLTSAAIVWFMLLAAMLLRAAIDDPEKRRRFAAVYGIVLIINEPFVRMATEWFSGNLHPARGTGTSGEGYELVASEFQLCIVAGLVGFVVLTAFRMALESVRPGER